MTRWCNWQVALRNLIAVLGACFCCYLATDTCTSTAIQLGTYFCFRRDNGNANAPQIYVVQALPVVFLCVWCLIWSCDVMRGIRSGQWTRILRADFPRCYSWKSYRPERNVGCFIFFSTTCNQTQLNDSLAEMGLWEILIRLLGLFLFGCIFFVFVNLQQQTADGGSWWWSMDGAVGIVTRFLAS
jgi:hypothetical protein